MRTRYILFLAAALLWVSCQRESRPLTPESTGIHAVMDRDQAVTKTILADNPGSRITPKWEARDAIGLYGTGTANARLEVSAASISEDGREADFRGNAAIPSGAVMAYLPYQESASRSGEDLVLDFPAVQYGKRSGAAAKLDPAAHIMIGEGTKEFGLHFRNVMAILKIGRVFADSTMLSKVEFRDRSGAAVCGSLKVSGGTAPKAEVTGDGRVITLDLGSGLVFGPGSMKPLYIIVPARDYPQGFELTFIAEDGNKTVKTVGAQMGKTLERGVVYPIGDISEYAYEGAVVRMNPKAHLVTPEAADLFSIISTGSAILMGADGEPVYLENGMGVFGPSMDLLVHKDMNLQTGDWLIFDYGSAQLPQGGILKVLSCDDMGGGYFRAYAETETNFAAPFEEVTIGKDEEYGGEDLDISSYITDILDSEGNSIPFSVSPSGAILFSNEATMNIPGIETKASASKNLSFPGLSLNIKEANAEAVFGAQLNLNMKYAIGIIGGEAQYVHFTVNPVLNLSAGFKLKAEFTLDKSMHLITLVTSPIPIAPGILVTPTLDIDITAGIGGELTFTASVKYKYDLGRYGISYNKGDGFTMRHTAPEPSDSDDLKFEADDLKGSLYAFGGLTFTPGLSVYGLLNLGVEASCVLKFGIEEGLFQEPKLFLQPEMEFTPTVASLGGYFTHKFSDLTGKLEFEPIWERYLYPFQVSYETGFAGPVKFLSEFRFIREIHQDGETYKLKMIMGPRKKYKDRELVYGSIDGIDYRISSVLPLLDTWEVLLDFCTGGSVYESDGNTYMQGGASSRYVLMKLPAGEGSKEHPLEAEGTIHPVVAQKEYFGFYVRYRNTRTGLVYEAGSKQPISPLASTLADIISWPSAPDGGEWFEERYDGGSWAWEDLPEKSPDSIHQLDGYYSKWKFTKY